MSILVPPIGWNVSKPWTPAEIGPYAWYDAELSPKTFGTGAQVATWEDISGNARHVTQSNAGNRPTYSSGDQWIDFNGSNQQLVSSGPLPPTGNNPFTIFAVTRADTTAGDRYFIGQGPNTGGNFVIGSSWQVSNQYVFAHIGAPLNGGSLVANTDAVTSWRYVSGARQFWVNGTSAASDAYTGSNPANQGTFIGSRGGAGWFDGKMRTSIFFRSALSTDDRQKCEGYLAWRWGLQNSLPVGHPYRNAPP